MKCVILHYSQCFFSFPLMEKISIKLFIRLCISESRIMNAQCIRVSVRSCTYIHVYIRMQMHGSRIYAQWQKCISIFQHRRRRLRRQKIYVKSQLNIFISRLQRGWVIALFTALLWRMLKLKPSFNLPRNGSSTNNNKHKQHGCINMAQMSRATTQKYGRKQDGVAGGRGTRVCNECDINFARFKIKQKRNLPWSKFSVLSSKFPIPGPDFHFHAPSAIALLLESFADIYGPRDVLSLSSMRTPPPAQPLACFIGPSAPGICIIAFDSSHGIRLKWVISKCRRLDSSPNYKSIRICPAF